MTMALNYNPKHRTTQGFFACMYFHDPQPSEYMLETLCTAAEEISEPLIIPFIIYETLTESFIALIGEADKGLEIFEQDGRFIEHGLAKYAWGDQDLSTTHGFDEIHKTVVNQHARLTSPLGPFLASLGPSLETAISTLELHFSADHQQGIEMLYNGFYSRQCLQIMLNRLAYKLDGRELLLQRVSVYLQVVCLSLIIIHYIYLLSLPSLPGSVVLTLDRFKISCSKRLPARRSAIHQP